MNGAGLRPAVGTPVKKFHHIQALRAIAASAVVVAHAGEYLVRRGFLGEEAYPVVWSFGWSGVATFFVISGLIMISSAGGDFGAGKSRDFLHRRIIRVVPLYWLMIAPFALATWLRGADVGVEAIAKTMFFVPYPSLDGLIRPVIPQGWTLNYEMMFYAIFAACLALPRRHGLGVLLAVFPALVAAGLLLRPLAPYDDPRTPLTFWTDPILLLFTIGMLIGLAARLMTRLRAPRPVLLSLAVLGASIAIFAAADGQFPLSLGWQAMFSAAGIVAVLLCLASPDRALTPADRVLERAGDASYSTYLVHQLVLMVLAVSLKFLPKTQLSALVFVVAAVIGCNVAGYVTHVLVERRLITALRRISGERPPQPAGMRAG